MIFIHDFTTEILNQQSQNDYLTTLRVVVKYIPHFPVKLDISYERVALAIYSKSRLARRYCLKCT